jgi:hypothetical protein
MPIDDVSAPIDPVPEWVNAIRSLFGAELTGLSFGGLDGEELDALAELVREAQGEVEAARKILAERSATLHEAQRALAKRSQQALAFAKIFAEGDEVLAARLGDLGPPRSASTASKEPRKRRRRKAPGASASTEERAEGAEGHASKTASAEAAGTPLFA